MAIEFHCPGCGKLMRTPDETAGKKGKCPTCGTRVHIPEMSISSSSLGAPSPPATTPRGQQPQASGASIQFACPSCAKLLTVPSANAGKKGKCPHCMAVMSIPMTSSSSTRPAPGASQKWKDAPKAPVSTRPAAAGPIAFRCPHCQCQVKVSAAASGKQGQCPRCQSVFTIPKKSFDAPRTAPDAAGGLMPLDSGLTPLGNDDFGALSPLGNTSDPFGGLGNLDFPAQDPLGGSPLASSPALGGPLGGMAPMPGGAMNPYSSPATFGSTAAAGSDHTGKPKRSGLPWDTQGDSSFLSTVKMLLFSPRTAFYKMRRTGGIGRPLLFCVMGTVIGVLISTAYNLIFQMVMLLIGGLGENADVAAAGFMIGAFAGMAFSVAGAAVGAVIASFLYSGIYHLFLMMFGGAREGFETTYRVYCYSAGAAAMCSVIPCVGGLVMFVVHLVTLIIGFWAGHETTLGRSIGAVLIPFVLCLAVAITAVVLVISAIMGGMAPVPE